MSEFEQPSKELIDAVETLLSEEFTVSNPIGDTINSAHSSCSVTLNDNTSLVFETVKDAVVKLYERTQQFC